MKVMVDVGVSCIRGSRKMLAVAGSSRSSFKGSALKMRIPSTVPTKSESSMDGDRERHRLFRARPLQAVGSACPSARIIIPQVIRRFMMPHAKFITNTSTYRQTVEKTPKSISNYWTGPAYMVALVLGPETA